MTWKAPGLSVVIRQVNAHDGRTRDETARYEAQLAAEGLAPVIGPQVVSFDDTGAAAADSWTEWARDVQRAHSFASPQQERAWRLYAEGTPVSKIATEMGIARKNVRHHIAHVKDIVGLPPVENPWKKRRENRARAQYHAPVRPGLLARFAKLALRCCDVGLLLELAHDDPELLQLLPKGDDMAEEKKKAAPGAVTYKRIVFKAGEAIQVPGVSVHKDVLLNVAGRPHAGGIDLTFDLSDGGKSIETIPWWRLKQATRVAGGGDE